MATVAVRRMDKLHIVETFIYIVLYTHSIFLKRLPLGNNETNTNS